MAHADHFHGRESSRRGDCHRCHKRASGPFFCCAPVFACYKPAATIVTGSPGCGGPLAVDFSLSTHEDGLSRITAVGFLRRYDGRIEASGAGVAELVDALDLGSSDESCGGSSPSARTTHDPKRAE